MHHARTLHARTLLGSLLLASAPLAQLEVGRFAEPSGRTGTDFNASLSLAGDLVVVGAPGPLIAPGDAYVFRRSDGSVVPLSSPLSQIPDLFGDAVATDGQRVLVSQPFAAGASPSEGAVFVYEQRAGAWTHVETLRASDPMQGDGFGSGLLLSGTTLLVGASLPGGPSGRGGVYVFELENGRWFERQKLAPPTPIGSLFGRAGLALSDDLMVVGDPSDPNFIGAAHVFRRGTGGWTYAARLDSADGGPQDNFGKSAAIGPDGAVFVGAPFHDARTINDGVVICFREGPGGWEECQRLLVPDPDVPSFPAISSTFGEALACVGDTLAIGAPGEGNRRGAVYFWNAANGLWRPAGKALEDPASRHESYGCRLASDGTTLAASIDTPVREVRLLLPAWHAFGPGRQGAPPGPTIHGIGAPIGELFVEVEVGGGMPGSRVLYVLGGSRDVFPSDFGGVLRPRIPLLGGFLDAQGQARATLPTFQAFNPTWELPTVFQAVVLDPARGTVAATGAIRLDPPR